jgi:Ca2+-binding RTX toxin-like protein
MPPIAPPRLRGRTRRVVLAAALPAALAVTALPSAAQANFVTLSNSGELKYEQTNVGNNNVVVRQILRHVRVQTSQAITGHTLNCERLSSNEVACFAGDVDRVTVDMGLGNDTVEYRAPKPGLVDTGAGNDKVLAGTREQDGESIQPVTYLGGTGSNTISYEKATSGVRLTPEDGLANDGRTIDKENVTPSFNTQIGSPFSDPQFFGTPANDTMNGLGGTDAIAGGFGDDRFITAPGDGADDYHGGPNRDTITYETRTTGMTIDLDNVADDGQLGEGDNVRSNIERVIGGSGVDRMFSLSALSTLEGRGGDDKLFGGENVDTLVGGPGEDVLDAGTGADTISARDGEHDTIDCGIDNNLDTLSSDLGEPSVDTGP